jgi:cytochrome c553
MKKIIWLSLFLGSITWISCSHYEQLQQNLVASESGDDESHNFGENCGSCHNVNGNEAVLEAGWWTVSGSVSNTQGRAQKNAVVELWEKPNKQGSLIKRLEVDDLGNFYTNQIINFKGGVYPSITTNNQTISMGTTFNGGSCNSCHGITTTKLTID